MKNKNLPGSYPKSKNRGRPSVILDNVENAEYYVHFSINHFPNMNLLLYVVSRIALALMR